MRRRRTTPFPPGDWRPLQVVLREGLRELVGGEAEARRHLRIIRRKPKYARFMRDFVEVAEVAALRREVECRGV